MNSMVFDESAGGGGRLSTEAPKMHRMWGRSQAMHMHVLRGGGMCNVFTIP